MNWAPLIGAGAAFLLAAAGFIRGETTRRAMAYHRNWHARQAEIQDQMIRSMRTTRQAATPVPRPATSAEPYPPWLPR